MLTVKIVPNKPDKHGHVLTQGTQVLVDGKQLRGVCSVSIHYVVDDVVRAEIGLMDVVQDPVVAVGDFYMGHPETNERKQVDHIVFSDGSKFRC